MNNSTNLDVIVTVHDSPQLDAIMEDAEIKKLCDIMTSSKGYKRDCASLAFRKRYFELRKLQGAKVTYFHDW